MGIISTRGGLGNTTVTLSLAKLDSHALAIDSNFGFRTFDMVLELEDVVYDFYDFVKGTPKEKCIFQKDHMDVLCGSASKTVADFSVEETAQRIFSLDYHNVFIDIPKVEEYIKFYAEVCNCFLLITKNESTSIRNLEKIIYLLQKAHKEKKIYVLFNRVEESIDFNKSAFSHISAPNVTFVEMIPECLLGNEVNDIEFSERLGHVLLAMGGKDYDIHPIHKHEKKETKKNIFQRIFGMKHE